MILLGAGIALFVSAIAAQPVFGSSVMVNGQQLFPDKKRPQLYYYLPPAYQLLTDATGKPRLSLVKMRYAGSARTGNAGEIKYTNILQFRIGTGKEYPRRLADTRAALRKKNPAAQLQMLPVRKFISLLVFAPAAPDPGADTASLRDAGVSDPGEEEAAANNGYWNEKTVTIRLSNIDAQLVESALRSGMTLMSFSYAFYSVFADRADLHTEVFGQPRLRKEVQAVFGKDAITGSDTAQHLTLVRADAFPVEADFEKWPGVISEIDINERLPAQYPLFDVYCYDFAQGLRADLWEKKIEIRATGVNGSEIQTGYSFRDDRPEVFARPIRFPYAVRFDKPFYYRITEIDLNGNSMVTEWKEKTDWSALLDISSPPEKIIPKAKPALEWP